jgi:hypothetical protein
MKSFALFAPVLAAASAAAHGIVTQMTINGQVFRGPRIGEGNPKSVIRQVSSGSPIKGANNPAINCGTNARPAALVANAQPGAALTFSWSNGGGGNWPHNTGPTLTYMASCGAVSCDKFDSSQAKWFKISQEGRKANGQWAQQDIMNGGPAHAQIPANLAPGNYLIRHEIIGLHIAQKQGGAEFYAACAQVKVSGNGNGRPNPSQLVSLPGAYHDNDSGIVGNFFNAAATYNFPGPAVVSLVAGGNPNPNPVPNPGNPTTAATNNPTTTATEDDDDNNTTEGAYGNGTPTPKPTPASSTTGTPKPKPKAANGTCTKKTHSPSVGAASSTPTPGSQEGEEDNTYVPRSFSRVFGRHHAIAQAIKRSLSAH